MLAFLIGVVQSVLLIACNTLIHTLTRKKFNVVSALMHPSEDVRWTDDGDLMLMHVDDRTDDTVTGDHSYDNKFYAFVGYPFFSYLFFQLLYTSISTAFVWIEPAAGGSGITEIKCLLNGINMPGLVEFKTLVCKVLGVCFSVSSGLPIGKEGPMFHSGAIVAAVLSQGQFAFRGFQKSFAELADFRNPWEKRDFIACGAAAGIASAFSAPIGGVLLSLEEGSSFWSTKLTWRAFFCAMISLFTLQMIKSASAGWGKEDIEKLFNFGEFNKPK
jgi:H+/Cl- antiporter ClcA